MKTCIITIIKNEHNYLAQWIKYHTELGIDTFLGKKGITLSDGQAQKIHLARLFIINPDIIILDEPTSALDIVAEKEVYDSLFSHFYDKTIIIVSHRRKVLDYCNKVFDFNMLGDRYEERA